MIKYNIRNFIKISVFVSSLMAFFVPSIAFAHPLDQTFSNIYINTGINRELLKPNTIQVEMYVSWQEMSYLYEKYTGAKLDSSDFDQHVKKFYADTTPQKNYISENIEVGGNGEDCDLMEFKPKKYEKEEVLVGKGIGIDMLFTCPVEKVESASFLNRMFIEDFSYQTHEVEFYSYNKKVLEGVIDKDNQKIVYPPEVQNNSIEVEKESKNFLINFFNKLVLLIKSFL